MHGFSIYPCAYQTTAAAGNKLQEIIRRDAVMTVPFFASSYLVELLNGVLPQSILIRQVFFQILDIVVFFQSLDNNFAGVYVDNRIIIFTGLRVNLQFG